MEIETNTNKRVAYYFDEEIGLYTFNKGHPMRPFRMKITDELINVNPKNRPSQASPGSPHPRIGLRDERAHEQLRRGLLRPPERLHREISF